MVESSANQNINGQIPYAMKSIITTYDMYGNPIHNAGVPQDTAPNMLPSDKTVNQPINENNFDVIMNKQNQMKQMHDMRDLMKSLN